ncbi:MULTISPECIES: non-ribosomal peptide synthetase [Rhizobium/Agrobacterium group]|uniref:non-ribosomal peptide synthetase n=1 Tax=Rhizobium/Agrobacterium group TaxID=227290 RepID=UPI000B3FBB7B|nr:MULTISPECIES: non-ribosomal peptide synthetase [Rhizobium/Agrobacterium group]NSZ43531.1 non-ribosomal peptide synthetase [Agrobacterium vitis]NTA27188.1 non-ribosomal peptide synthetase [Allorhizobium ampelinum]OVE94263.1 non-ribosomal peptide synthetase [Allorhizobium ampelinum]
MSFVGRHEQVFPVSLAQAGLWVKQKVAPADLSFVLAESIEIHGPVHPGLFCQALRRLSDDVAVTRSRIKEIEGQPHQVVMAAYCGVFDVIDFSGADNPGASAMDWMRKQMSKPLDLANDNLWGSSLLKLGATEWVWYHWAHHIIMDGFSGGLLARRLADIYSALAQGNQPEPYDCGSPQELLELERTYRDSVHFQRDKAYWSEQMKGLPEPVTLMKKKGEPSGGLLRHTTVIDRQTVKALAEISRGFGASVPQALIALVAAYYAKATDCEELTMVTMVTARISQTMRRIPGMTANAVPLRFSITPDLSWRELTGQVSQQMSRALRYQRYRYEDIRRDLGMVRQDAQIAWLGVNIEPFDYDLRFDGQPTTVHNLSNGTMTDFTIFAYDRGDNGDLRIDFDANPALYTLEELADHEARFTRMLREILATPEQPLRDFSLLSKWERQEILTDWNDTSHKLPDQTWPELFRAQAARTPDAVALSFGGRQMTYGELDAASDHLAGYLMEKGAVPGSLVAVAVPRSENMVVALLAVLKSGAAYLPLDPADPASRVAMILEDAQPACVITTEEVAGNLPDATDNLIFLDKPLERQGRDLPKGPSLTDTAYIIFTSGSTGRPKGVEIPHRGLMNFLLSMQDLLKLDSEDRLLAVTTISFDIAALELYLPLLAGARTVIALRSEVRDPAVLHGLIRSAGITIMQATPSLWRALLADHHEGLTGLRSLVGGEALPADLAHKMARLGHPVLNVYGPTETTIWSTNMPLLGSDLDSAPIGRPIWNTRVYVLDRHCQPVPPGFIGELYIGGAGVAKGYLNRPDLTAEKFMADPFAGEGERIYRTGDLVRWRRDGVLDYLGRNDHQIKIRGFRVEPGEIEAALSALPQVREAVVILRDDPGREKRLVAYVVPREGAVGEVASLDAADLSERLGKVLPVHMIPAAYVVLDAIPLNSNGKTDRHALPVPQWTVTEGIALPGTDAEKRLAALWCEILGLEQIGIHDSFFVLGGDSLAAAGMISAVRSRLKGEIPLGAVFETPTIAALAVHLDEASSGSPLIEPVLAIRAKGERPPLFCIHPVLGLGWSFFSLAQHLSEDVPVYALQSDGLHDLAALPRSIEDMAALYVQRIRKIQPQGPYHLLGWSLGGLIAHEMTRQLQAEGQAIAFLGMMDSYHFKPAAQLQDDATLARAALGFLGFDEKAAGDKPSLAELGDFVLKMFDTDNHVLLEQVHQFDPDFVERAKATILHNLEIAQRFTPGKIDADVHFFRAEPSAGSDALNTILNYDAETWLPHVGGRVYLRDMTCNHHDMLNMEPASHISAVVQAELLREFLVLRRPQTEVKIERVSRFA